MLPDDLRAWQGRMALTTYSAPEALGVSRAIYMRWLAGSTPISRVVALACTALESGLEPAPPQDGQPRTD